MSATREQAKQYLANHKIPQMFESLLSCLMIERPSDPIGFLEGKMAAIREVGLDKVNWETFVMSLHPYRDPVRLGLVRDGSKYDREMTEGATDTLSQVSTATSVSQTSSMEMYRPDLFQLTETQS